MMQSLVYTDQSADELRLNLVRGAVDKKKLTVLCTGVIGLSLKDDYRLEVGIIGASHYLELKDFVGNVLLTEVFACVQCVELKPQERIFSANLREVDFVDESIKGFSYQFKAHKTSWEQSAQDFCALGDVVMSKLTSHQLGLIYSFPKGRSDKFSPTTLVYAEFDGKVVNIKTVHAYPNEENLVFTNTRIKEDKGDIQ